jgi:hypothetical protein
MTSAYIIYDRIKLIKNLKGNKLEEARRDL